MSLELLVEIPQEVSQIINLGEVANNLGLRAPTVFVMEGGFALVNGETGTLYRKYTLSDTKAKIVDCVYLPGIRSFILALADSSIITVPEQSKNPNETVLERWPVAIRKLIVAGEQEVYVHAEGGCVCHVAVKDLKVKAPASGKASPIDNKVVEKSDYVAGNSHYLAVVYATKKSAKATSSEQILAIWKHSTPAAGSSQWLDVNNNLHNKQDLDAQQIVQVVADENQNSFSMIVQGSQKNTCNWNKYDYNGTKLFERTIAGIPSMVDVKGGVMWFYNADRFTCWNPRYGTEIKSMDSPNINKGLPCIVSGGSDGLAISLLIGNVVDKNGPTNIYRKEIGNAAKFSKRSLFDNLGSLPHTVTDENSNTKNGKSIHALDNLSEEFKTELLSVKAKYEKKRQLEAITEPSSSHNKKLRKIDLTTSTPASVGFLQSLEHTEEFNEDDWDVTKVLIRNGTLTLHSNPSILKQIVQNTRLDVLVELVRYASDLTEQHVIQIIKYCMTLPTEVEGYKVFGAAIVKVTEENKHLFTVAVAKEEVVPETTDKKGKKKTASKKEIEEKVTVPSSSSAKLSVSQLDLLRAVMEASSLRVATFASPLISEAVQPLDVKTSCLLLRILAFSLNELCALKAMHDPSATTKHVFSQFGDHEIKVMVSWMEAILDAHFTEISLQASSQESIRRALFNAIQAIKSVQESFEFVEEALSLCTQIERIASKKSDVSKPVLGLYQVETLRL